MQDIVQTGEEIRPTTYPRRTFLKYLTLGSVPIGAVQSVEPRIAFRRRRPGTKDDVDPDLQGLVRRFGGELGRITEIG